MLALYLLEAPDYAEELLSYIGAPLSPARIELLFFYGLLVVILVANLFYTRSILKLITKSDNDAQAFKTFILSKTKERDVLGRGYCCRRTELTKAIFTAVIVLLGTIAFASPISDDFETWASSSALDSRTVWTEQRLFFQLYLMYAATASIGYLQFFIKLFFGRSEARNKN
ncbi:hypothetical protein T5B8_02985 [Salinisphaera sp. T5B8]